MRPASSARPAGPAPPASSCRPTESVVANMPGQEATVADRRQRPRWTVGRLLATGFVLAVAALLVVGGSAFVRIRALIHEQRAVTQATLIQSTTDAILSAVKDAETGQRGYVITGKPEYLGPYHQSLRQISNHLATLRTLLAPDARQLALLHQLQAPLDNKLRELAETIQLRQIEGFAAAQAVVLTDRGAKDMAD